MTIKINKHDIFNFVVGNTGYDPIEKQIDPIRFEVFNHGIWDRKLKKNIDQEEDYVIFCTQVYNLKQNAKSMNSQEIMDICFELEEIAPKKINLE